MDDDLAKSEKAEKKAAAPSKPVVLATRRGEKFLPRGKNLPSITSAGVSLSRSDANKVLEEANSAQAGLVFEVTEKEGE